MLTGQSAAGASGLSARTSQNYQSPEGLDSCWFYNEHVINDSKQGAFWAQNRDVSSATSTLDGL